MLNKFDTSKLHLFLDDLKAKVNSLDEDYLAGYIMLCMISSYKHSVTAHSNLDDNVICLVVKVI